MTLCQTRYPYWQPDIHKYQIIQYDNIITTTILDASVSTKQIFELILIKMTQYNLLLRNNTEP